MYSMILRVNHLERWSLNNGLKCRKPVFMRVSGIYFTKWLYFGSICGVANNIDFSVESDISEYEI